MKFVFLLLPLFIMNTVFADTFYINEVKGSDLSSQDKNSVRELIRMSLPSGHAATTQAAQADWILSPQLLKLGDAYLLGLEKKNSKTNKTFYEKMKSANMANMDVTAQRLTQAVITETQVASTADVTSITDEEKKQNMNRIEATRQWLLGIGPSWTQNLNLSGGGFTFLIGYEWGLDPDYSVDLSYIVSSGRGDDDSRFGDFSIGGTYYLSRKKFSPFANVRLGYGSSDINDNCSFLCSTSPNESTGWSGSVAIGYKFFRTSTVNVAPMLRYSQIFDKGDLGSAAMTSFIIAVYY